jgi:tellurite resistance protein
MTSFETQDLYHAVIAAFSLVAYADGQVHMSEMSRLVTTLKSEGLFKAVSPQQMQDDIFALVKDLDDDFEKEQLPALLAIIGKIKDEARGREVILKIACLTLLADGKVTESEEKILADIHRTLGVSEH